ncbi:MAG TPA: HAD hydrolase-like protein [Lysobacter sp.]
MAISLCLFDLDNTLVRTSDLVDFRGSANVNNASGQYTNALTVAFDASPGRVIYSLEQHQALRQRFPEMKWGVFTRSPRHYARTLLARAYPGLAWDTIIGFEDVHQTKPDKEGVWSAMKALGIDNPDEVALVGDEKVDIQCAYQSGCWSVLDQSSWNRPWAGPNFWAIERIPDAIIHSPSDLGDVLENPGKFLPELELRSTGLLPGTSAPRIDRINHFFPVKGENAVPVAILGKLFGEYEALVPRHDWHELTSQVLAHKDATEFPDSWIQAIRRYLKSELLAGAAVVTVIPFKPGRHPRLEALLAQLERSHQATPILPKPLFAAAAQLTFNPSVLSFKPGAVSSHGMHLKKDDRFINVRENLFVQQPCAVKGRRVVVIDDVVTSGATLLWAHRYLQNAGASSVHCMSLTKAIGVG